MEFGNEGKSVAKEGVAFEAWKRAYADASLVSRNFDIPPGPMKMPPLKSWYVVLLGLLALLPVQRSLAVVVITQLHDVVIGRVGDRDLHADIAYPNSLFGRLPAVIYIHGGGWNAGTYHTAPLVELARAGYFAASIEYRLSGDALWPAQLEDCQLGVRWLRTNAAKYRVDPNRIGAWGDSAGGHLVACLGTMADVKDAAGDGQYPGISNAVQAVVIYYGPTDLTTPAIADHLTALEGLFGTTYALNPALWKSASPLYAVKPGDPPMFLVQGDSDQAIPVSQSIIFAAALAKAGVPHQLLIVKNAGHDFAPASGIATDPSPGQINRAVLDFLYKYLRPR